MNVGLKDLLATAIACLLGYQWPMASDSDEFVDLVDDDGIICVPSVRGEASAAERIEDFLGRALGPDWNSKTRDEALSHANAPARDIKWWIENRFFEQHCQLFQRRPFIWHIWDGVKVDGFSALVNYHKLDRKLLDTLTYTYLGDWIRRRQDDVDRNVEGATSRLEAARQLQQRLELILTEGVPTTSLFAGNRSTNSPAAGIRTSMTVFE